MKRTVGLGLTVLSMAISFVIAYLLITWLARRARYSCVGGNCIECTPDDWKSGICQNLSEVACKQQCGYRCNGGMCEPCRPSDVTPCPFSESQCLSENGFPTCGYNINGYDQLYETSDGAATLWAETCTACDGSEACDNYPNGLCGNNAGFTCSQYDLGMCVKCSDQASGASCQMHPSRLDGITCGVDSSTPCPIFTCFDGACHECVHGQQSLDYADEYNCYLAVNGKRTAFFDSTCGGGLGCDKYYCRFNGQCAACDQIDPFGTLGLCGPTEVIGRGDGTTYDEYGEVLLNGVSGALTKNYCDENCEKHVRWFCDNTTRTCKTTTPENGFIDEDFGCTDGECNWFESAETCQIYCTMAGVCESTTIPVLRDADNNPEAFGVWTFHSSVLGGNKIPGEDDMDLAELVQIPYRALRVASLYPYFESESDSTTHVVASNGDYSLEFNKEAGKLVYKYIDEVISEFPESPPVCDVSYELGVHPYGILYLRCGRSDETQPYWQTNHGLSGVDHNTHWASQRGIGDHSDNNIDSCYQANAHNAFLIVQGNSKGWGLAAPVFGDAMGFESDVDSYRSDNASSVYNHLNSLRDARNWIGEISHCEDISLADLKQNAGYGDRDRLTKIMPDNSVMAQLPRLKCSQVYAESPDGAVVLCRARKAACVADSAVATLPMHRNFDLYNGDAVVRADNFEYSITTSKYSIPGGNNKSASRIGMQLSETKPQGVYAHDKSFDWGQLKDFSQSQCSNGATGKGCISRADGTTVPIAFDLEHYLSETTTMRVPDTGNYMQAGEARLVKAYPIVDSVHTVLVSDDRKTHLGVYASSINDSTTQEYQILKHLYTHGNPERTQQGYDGDEGYGKADVVLRTEITPNTWLPVWVGGVRVVGEPSFELKEFTNGSNSVPALAVVEHQDDSGIWEVGKPPSTASNPQLVMQLDGNLILKEGDENLWISNTAGNPGAYVKLVAAVGGDANLQIYRADRTLITNWTPTNNVSATSAPNGKLYSGIPNEKRLYGYDYVDVLTDPDFVNPGEPDTLGSGQSLVQGKCLASGPCKLLLTTSRLRLVLLEAQLLLGDWNATYDATSEGVAFAGISMDRGFVIARTEGVPGACEEVTFDMLRTDKDLFCENVYVENSDNRKQKCTTEAFVCDYSGDYPACLPSAGQLVPGTNMDHGATTATCSCMASCNPELAIPIQLDSQMLATFAFDYSIDSNKSTAGFAIANARKYCYSPEVDGAYGRYTFNDSRADPIIRFESHGGNQDQQDYSGVLAASGKHGIEENPILMTYFGMCDYYAQKAGYEAAALVVDSDSDGCAHGKQSVWERIQWADVKQTLFESPGGNERIPPHLGCCVSNKRPSFKNDHKSCPSGYGIHYRRNLLSALTDVGLGANSYSDADCCRQDPFPHASDVDYLNGEPSERYEASKLYSGVEGHLPLTDGAYWLACHGCYWTKYLKDDFGVDGPCDKQKQNPADAGEYRWRGWDQVYTCGSATNMTGLPRSCP